MTWSISVDELRSVIERDEEMRRNVQIEIHKLWPTGIRQTE